MQENQSAPLAIRLNLVVLRSKDLDVAEKFYNALGLIFKRHAHGAGPIHLASETGDRVNGTDFVFEIYPRSLPGSQTTGTRIGFIVSNIESTIPGIVAAGGQVKTGPEMSPWGVRAVVVDPDGHKIELIEDN